MMFACPVLRMVEPSDDCRPRNDELVPINSEPLAMSLLITMFLYVLAPDVGVGANPVKTLPLVSIVSAVVAPLLPTLKRMLSLVPTPEVDCSVREDEAVVPPMTVGTVTELLGPI